MKLYTGLLFLVNILVVLTKFTEAALYCKSSGPSQSALRQCCHNEQGVVSGLSYNRQEGACMISYYFCDYRVTNPINIQSGDEYLKSCTGDQGLECGDNGA
ncbi:hypothetical protein BJV82DRAFT_625312 [Fennellomyces sp. T-0311]|nr:hypothetical protein BJV82DRAFT_625312 [Fennellomyces sp. T-0311]